MTGHGLYWALVARYAPRPNSTETATTASTTATVTTASSPASTKGSER
jgi:hypothetical protein